jgi:serine/threonine protein kinase
MTAHLTEVPVAPSQRNPALNTLLDAVILKALAKDPDDRYQSAREFYHCILNPSVVYVPPPPVAVRPPAVVEPEVAPPPPLNWKTIVIGAVALVTVAAIWVMFLASAAPAP